MKHFQQIIIQSKDDTEDFRAFCHCEDTHGQKWVLRGYGNTASKAADNAWERYLDHDNWENYGERCDKKTD